MNKIKLFSMFCAMFPWPFLSFGSGDGYLSMALLGFQFFSFMVWTKLESKEDDDLIN
jgi:hypothetical protein